MQKILSLILAGCALTIFFSISFEKIDMREHRSSEETNEPTPAAAIDYFYNQRAYPHDNFSTEHYIAEYHRAEAMRAEESLTTTTSWRSLGPTNVAGRVLSIAMSPSDTTQVWVGTASGGLWRLTDKGDSNYSWKPIETGFPSLSVNTIYIDSSVNPEFSNIVFIGTGEVYSYRNAMPSIGLRTSRGMYGIGILYSTDNGTTWNQSLSFTDSGITGVNKIIANPRRPTSMYAATTEGIYKSYDLGRTWSLKLSQLMVTDIVINRTDTTTLFAACGDQGGQTTGIFRSTDAGEHWKQVGYHQGLPDNFTGRASLAIDRLVPNIIFAGISDEFGTQGLYRSSNNGDSWTLVSDSDWCGLQGWYANVVTINPFFFDIIYCGGVNLWSSQVNGFNLRKNQNPIHVDIHAIDFSPFDGKTLYVGTDGGVYKTTNGGLSFSDRNTGLITTQFYNRFSNATDDSTIALGGTQDNGTLLYNGSLAWKSILGGDGSWPVISSDNHGTLFTQYENLTAQKPVNAGPHVYRSTDGGNSLSTVFLADTVNDAFAFTTPIVQAPSDPNTMFIATSKIYKSTDKGLQWNVADSGKDVDALQPGANPFISLAISRNSTDTIYGVTAPIAIRSGVFISTNGGNSWMNITDTLPNRFPTDVAIDPNNAATAYITFSGFGGEHVFKTTNAGVSWVDITGALPDVPANTVLTDPRSSQVVYVGNDLGAYSSTDGGKTWQSFMTGMPTAIVMSLTYSKANNTIRAATHGRGVYERPALTPPTNIVEHPAGEPVSFSVFPTVLSSSDNAITISLPQGNFGEWTSLVLCDITGKIIQKIGEGAELNANNNIQVNINTRLLANGIYYLALRSRTATLTKKILLAK